MLYETVHNFTLPKIGFGTWKIGGENHPRPEWDDRSLAALHSALAVGYRHFDTAEAYAKGRSEELIGRALRETYTRREEVILTSKVHPKNLSYKALIEACENSLRNLGTNYIDLYLIHWPTARMSMNATFRALNELVRDGRVKHLGVSNFNLRQLKQAQKFAETPIVANQVPYSLTDRSYVKNGMLEYCQQNDIFLVAYSPLDQGKLQSSRTLANIAAKHEASIHQIALAWLVSQPRVATIPMSFNLKHIQENFRAADIILTASEMRRLTNLQ
ncbi:MAG TPA: aldo/keto reductase [Anaerolineales bacterium]|nr:aldo/keto reductase [Anaerolineales bacterium]